VVNGFPYPDKYKDRVQARLGAGGGAIDAKEDFYAWVEMLPTDASAAAVVVSAASKMT